MIHFVVAVNIYITLKRVLMYWEWVPVDMQSTSTTDYDLFYLQNDKNSSYLKIINRKKTIKTATLCGVFSIQLIMSIYSLN